MTDQALKGKPTTAFVRKRAIERLRRLFGNVEGEYPAFLADARQLLPLNAVDARFAFVMRRLWMDYAGEVPGNWDSTLEQRYAAFCSAFDWSMEGTPPWVKPALVHRTLSLYQQRYPILLETQDALGIILSIGALETALRRSA